MFIRQALITDAEHISLVLHKSIRELCVLDHGQDPLTIDQWLDNKKPENVRSWIEAPSQRILVAENEGGIIGVGGVSHAGKITLNYVSPNARFQGVSKSILTALETYSREAGNIACTLLSTRTAHPFYTSAGYREIGEPEYWGKLIGYPMKKSL